MPLEESSRRVNVNLHKLLIVSIKGIPMLLAGLFLMNTLLSYFDIDIPTLSYVVFWILILFLYLTSYAFKFCLYHRMFLHYIVFNTIVTSIDYEYELPISNWNLFVFNVIVAGMFLFITLYLKFKK